MKSQFEVRDFGDGENAGQIHL